MLTRLVNDLLQLARADAGCSLAKEPVEVLSILDETIRQARQLDPERSIQLDASSNLDVIGDRDALKQVLLIVLDNALKHSNGAIDVSALQKGSQVEIRVQDFGEGISPRNSHTSSTASIAATTNPPSPDSGWDFPSPKRSSTAWAETSLWKVK